MDNYDLYDIKAGKNVAYRGVILLIQDPRPQDRHVMYVAQRSSGIPVAVLALMDLHKMTDRMKQIELRLWNADEHQCNIIAKVEDLCTKEEEVRATTKVFNFVSNLMKEQFCQI